MEWTIRSTNLTAWRHVGFFNPMRKSTALGPPIQQAGCAPFLLETASAPVMMIGRPGGAYSESERKSLRP